jgi:predicted amidohydrolase
VRVLLTSVLCQKGETETNLARHRELHGRAAAEGCDLLLMPEMSLTGYLDTAATDLGDAAVAELVGLTRSGPAVCFGLVERRAGVGLPWITQVTAARGEVLSVHRKAYLGEDEDPYFAPGPPTETFELGGVTLSVAVCAEIGDDRAYGPPARLVLGPAAPGLYEPRRHDDAAWLRGLDWWRQSVIDDARRLLGPDQWLAVSTQAGATVDEDFPGWAGLIGPGGLVAAELPDWREATLAVDIP